MKTQFAFVADQIENEISSLFGQIAYCNAALASDIKEWERKEYSAVIDDCYAKISELESHLDAINKMKS